MRATVNAWGKVALLVGGMAAAAAALSRFGVRWQDLSPEQVRAAVLAYGWWSPAAYLLLFAQPLVPLPASVMAMAAGLSFGPALGFVAAWGAGAVRACGQFLLAKACGRGVIERLLRGRLAEWDRRLGEAGFLTVLWIRVVPNVPFDLQNFGLGCSRIAIGPFALATLLGIIPGIFLWVYLGHTLTTPREGWKIAAALIALAALWLVRHRIQQRQVMG
jgi:uncharacterized membrane protein YdjX (TVP38/TMEM64 family)